MRRLRLWARGSSGQAVIPAEILDCHRRQFHHAFAAVRVFYALHFFHLSRAFAKWSVWSGVDRIEGLWPLRGLLEILGTAGTVHGVLLLFTVGVLLAVLEPDRRSFRILCALGLFLYAALDNSFGKIDHGHHAWIYVGFFLIFLPDGDEETLARRISSRQEYLLVFAAAQAMFLLCYSLSGFWKVQVAVGQALSGGLSAFSQEALSYQIADRLLQTSEDTLLGPWLIEHPAIGPLLLWAGIYLELFAFWAVFRPSLQRFWGLLIISLHLTSLLTLSIAFLSNVLLAANLLILTPFHPRPFRPLQALGDLPLVGPLWKLTRRLRLGITQNRIRARRQPGRGRREGQGR